ncbi:Wadjet anti-phage system protein JetD domain-containing protein [Streptomyces bacillaris]|uniref:Wadjet anti-phage system protein JetD domain-containing protein n=1 Tax=Streptomyces bacillaris TaxID=68179 RepID=UPI003702AD24
MNPSTSANVTLSPRAMRLAAALEEWPRRTLTLAELWEVFAIADAASAMRPSRRTDLAEAIEALTAAGLISCSHTQDTSVTPALPTRLKLPAPQPSPTAAAAAQAIAWRPELAWAASARLTLGQIGTLRSINDWLRDCGRDDDVAPLRERSLEVLGHEKRLDALLNTSLFAPGRLTLELLRTFRAHPPLSTRRIGGGPVLLVVENADTFDTLTRVLTAIPGDVGRVAWGAGAAFEASVASVLDMTEVRAIAYFGDLDADGLRIPASAHRRAAQEGLPPVRPAAGLYRLLLEIGVPQPGQTPVSHGKALELAGWLSEPLATRAASLLAAGCRLAQEAVGMRALQARIEVNEWRDGLAFP